MELALRVAQQVSVIFLLCLVGIICERKGILDIPIAKRMTDLVLMMVFPFVLVSAFQLPFTNDMLPEMLLALGLAVVYHLMAGLLVRMAVRPGVSPKADDQVGVERFGAAYSNCGFMGLPLLTAVLGEKGFFYGALFLGVFAVSHWTDGYKIVTGEKHIHLKQAFFNPGCIGLGIGLLLFVLRIQLPIPLLDFTKNMASLNTPVGMIITGVFLSRITPRSVVGDKRVVWVVCLRNVLLPALMLVLIWVCRVPSWFPAAGGVALGNLLSCGCASGINTILFGQKFGGDGHHGAKVVALSTVLSILTLPLLVYIAQLVL